MWILRNWGNVLVARGLVATLAKISSWRRWGFMVLMRAGQVQARSGVLGMEYVP